MESQPKNPEFSKDPENFHNNIQQKKAEIFVVL